MKRTHVIPVILVLAAVIGTAAVVMLRQPDVIHAVGDNGRVIVDGLGVGTPVIENAGVRPGTAIPIEDVSLNGLPVPTSFTITLSYDPSVRAHAPRPLSLFAEDSSLSAWRRVPSVDDTASATLSALTTVASQRWTYAILPDDAVGPEAKVVFDQLTSFPPEGAVGYRAYAAVTQGDDEFFLLGTDVGSGG